MIQSRPLPTRPQSKRHFPPEIIQLILDASLDPYDLFGVYLYPKNRYSTLKNYSLLNSTWREIAKPALFEWVVLHSQRAADNFLWTARTEGGTIRLVVSMEIAGDIRPGVVLNRVPYLKDLSLAVKEVNMQDLARLHQLTRLSLSANVPSFPKLLCIPRLKSLFLYVTGHDFPDQLLTSRALPALRELSTTTDWISNSARSLDLTMVQQLYALHIWSRWSQWSPVNVSFVPRATSLRLLSAVHSPGMNPPLEHHTRFLLLHHTTPSDIIQALQHQIERSNPGLRSIFINDWVLDRSLDDSIACLIEKLGARGVSVTRGNFPFRLVCRQVEAILAKEFREAAERAEAYQR